jgi:hypothetical protein
MTPCPAWRSGLSLLLLLLACLLGGYGRGALAAEPAVVLTVAQAEEGFIVDATMEVAVSQAIAWDVMTDFEHMSAIFSNVKASRVIRREGNTLVTRQEGVARFGFLSMPYDSEREIRLEPMRRILARDVGGSLKSMESETLIQPNEQGVHIRYHAEIVPDSFLGRLFGPAFAGHVIEEQFLAMAGEMLRRKSRPDTAGRTPDHP